MTANAPDLPQRSCSCPRLDFDAWENRNVSFDRKPYLRRSIPLFFRIPIGLRDEIRALEEKAQALKLTLADPHQVLERAAGYFRGELLLAIADPVTIPEVTVVTGKYRATVFRGRHALLGWAIKKCRARLRAELGVEAIEVYLWYATCPRCAAEAGGPATIILARIGNPEAHVLETRL